MLSVVVPQLHRGVHGHQRPHRGLLRGLHRPQERHNNLPQAPNLRPQRQHRQQRGVREGLSLHTQLDGLQPGECFRLRDRAGHVRWRGRAARRVLRRKLFLGYVSHLSAFLQRAFAILPASKLSFPLLRSATPWRRWRRSWAAALSPGAPSSRTAPGSAGRAGSATATTSAARRLRWWPRRPSSARCSPTA